MMYIHLNYNNHYKREWPAQPLRIHHDPSELLCKYKNKLYYYFLGHVPVVRYRLSDDNVYIILFFLSIRGHTRPQVAVASRHRYPDRYIDRKKNGWTCRRRIVFTRSRGFPQ